MQNCFRPLKLGYLFSTKKTNSSVSCRRDKSNNFKLCLASGFKSCLHTSQIFSQNFNLIVKNFEVPTTALKLIFYCLMVYMYTIDVIKYNKYFQTLR